MVLSPSIGAPAWSMHFRVPFDHHVHRCCRRNSAHAADTIPVDAIHAWVHLWCMKVHDIIDEKEDGSGGMSTLAQAIWNSSTTNTCARSAARTRLEHSNELCLGNVQSQIRMKMHMTSRPDIHEDWSNSLPGMDSADKLSIYSV